MQALNFYPNPTPVSKEAKIVQQNKKNKDDNFAKLMKNTQDKAVEEPLKASNKKEDIQEKSNNSKQQDSRKDSKMMTKELATKEEVVEKKELENPQDSLQLTQVFNGLPILPTQEVIDVVTDKVINLPDIKFAEFLSEQTGLDDQQKIAEENQQQINPEVKSGQNTQQTSATQQNFLPAWEKVENSLQPEMQPINSEKQTGQQVISVPIKQLISLEKNAAKDPETKNENIDVNQIILPVATKAVSGETAEEKGITEEKSALWRVLSSKVEVKQEPFFSKQNEQKKGEEQKNSITSVFAPTIEVPTAKAQSLQDSFSASLKTEKKEIIEQIVQKVQINFKPGQTEMKMHLRPEHLGELQMKLLVEDGKVTAQFLTANHDVKETIESNFQQLKQSLQEQGIKVEKLSVLIGGGNLQFNQGRKEENQFSNQKVAKNWRKLDSVSYDYNQLEETQNSGKQIISSEQVDYKA